MNTTKAVPNHILIDRRSTHMIIMPSVISTLPESSDKDFMEQIYIKYHRGMYHVVWRFVNDPESADDIVSESCLALIKHIGTMRRLEPKALTTYINLSVRNTAYNYLKKRQRLKEYLIGDSDIINRIPDQFNIENQVIINDELARVKAALHQLPEKDQLILCMKFGSELPDTEIARQTGLSPNSISKYVSRAREKLKKILYAAEKK